MYHSITIGDKNTWDDWKMIPVSRPVVAPPVEKILSVNVPGRDGTTYLSKSLTGYPVFKAREGSWEFYLDTDEWRGQNLSTPVGTGALEYLSRALAKSNSIPAQTRVRLEDDPAFFYLGRVWVNGGVKQKNGHSVVTFAYSLYPFKFLYDNIQEDWVWDTFGFETDLAVPYCKDIPLKALQNMTFRMPPSEKPSLLQAKWTGNGLLAISLAKSQTYPYEKAKERGLPAVKGDPFYSSTLDESMGKTDIGLIDNDLRYDVYEVGVSAAGAGTLSLYYQPAYL